jgi:UDP-N-acetylmuramoyl-tripeptide--D-alanyl-D-alanine ligase
MSVLWSAEDFVAATGGRPLGTMPVGIGGISIDSRSLQPGDAFFAIKGEAMDGHDYATAALAAGASVVVISEAKLPAFGRVTAPMVVVTDVLAALEKLGVAARKRSKAKIIAVTGSAGKTTTKEALRHVLSAVGRVHASDKSFNNHWGVPLTLARMPANCEYAIFEIGMNHAGEIRPLVKMVRPHVAIVTLIAAAHLGHFRSLEDIAAAKAEIFEGLAKGGTALINRDDARWKVLERLAKEAGVQNIAGFGEHLRATYKLLDCKLFPDHSTIVARIGGKEIVARIGVPGRHIVQNALAVLGAADLVGAPVPQVSVALGDLTAEQGRGQRHMLKHPRGRFVLIDESYNANPASMAASLAMLKATPVEGGRRIAVLGDMLELGKHAPKLHAGLADLVIDSQADRVFLAADALPTELKVEYRANASELEPLLLNSLRPGDAVMVKSSKGIGFSKLVESVLRKFPADGAAGTS